MIKIVLLFVCCCASVFNSGYCHDRITISQFLSFLDKITVLCKETRESIPKPNSIKSFKFEHVYESPETRHLYGSLPGSVKDLLPQFTPTPTPTTTLSTQPTYSTASVTTEQSSSSSTLTSEGSTSSTTEDSSTSTTAASTASSEETSSTESSTESSSTMSTKKTSSSSSEDPTPPSVEISVDSRKSSDYDEDFSFSFYDYWSREKSFLLKSIDDSTKDSEEFLTRFGEESSKSREYYTSYRNINNIDKDKIVEIINDKIYLATVWGMPIAIYKKKLQYFEENLSNSFPTTFLERRKARLLAKEAMITKPFILEQLKRIIRKAAKYRETMKEGISTMNYIIVLLEAATNLPDLLLKSLLG